MELPTQCSSPVSVVPGLLSPVQGHWAECLWEYWSHLGPLALSVPSCDALFLKCLPVLLPSVLCSNGILKGVSSDFLQPMGYSKPPSAQPAPAPILPYGTEHQQHTLYFLIYLFIVCLFNNIKWLLNDGNLWCLSRTDE